MVADLTLGHGDCGGLPRRVGSGCAAESAGRVPAPSREQRSPQRGAGGAVRQAVRGRAAQAALAGSQQQLQRLVTVARVVGLRVRHRVVGPLRQQQRQRQVVQRRGVRRAVTGADAAAILSQRDVAAIVVGALHLPVTTLQGQQLLRRGGLLRQRGDGRSGTCVSALNAVGVSPCPPSAAPNHNSRSTSSKPRAPQPALAPPCSIRTVASGC